MKKLKLLIIVFLLIIGVSSVKADRTFDTTVKIYDYAQVLTEKQETNLKKNVDKYIEKYNVDMVLVTVKHYNQNTLEEYMDLFYNTNKFGIGNNKDGIMIVIDLKGEKQVSNIKTFGLASDLYSQNEINEILQKIEKEENYEDKLSTFIKYSNKYINEFDGVTFEDDILISIDWLGITVISLILSTIIMFIGLLKSKQKCINKKNNNYIKSLIITTKEDSFITTNTKKRRIGSEKN